MSKKFITNFRGEYCTPNGKIRIKDEPVTPVQEDFGFNENLDYDFENDFNMRKSMSMNDIATLKEDLIKLEFADNKEDVYHRHRRPTGLHQELSKTKFVSMAEAIYHYQRDTPDRFHSSRPRSIRPQSNVGRSGLTVPQSPMLRCKGRSRPQHIISQKEKEELEIEELKKFKIKANPIPKSVIEGPIHLPEVSKKPITVPEPFKLTEIPKKTFQSPGQVHNFKARPAPKHILEKPQIPPKTLPQVTKPVSPKFHYKRVNSADHLKHGIKTSDSTANVKKTEKCEKTMQRQGPVKPEPFSFEKRDEELKRKREERIKKQLEEDRKLASQFKAQPLPTAVKKRMQNTATLCSASNASSENKENYIKFEAKPPVVLYKEPFKPVLQPVQLIKSVPFELTTEKRAAERERFEKQLKEKEEENERLKQQKEKEQKEAEERAITELRAKLVHHAKPVPPLNPFVPEKSVAPITKKPGKTAEELQEEEELQLALALSQSEAEHKEKERRTRSYIAPENTLHPTISPTPSSVSASPEHSTTNSELSRYLDRNYWEQRLTREAANAPTAPAPSSHATNEPTEPEFVKPNPAKNQDDEAEEKEIDEFVESLKSQVEIFVNRMKSNSSRGRSIANDTSVQTLFMNITAMHSKLLRYIQQQDDKRVYLESLQDKINQVRDSRAALDTLRAEHAARLAQAAEAAERQRQMQMAVKLQAMRKKKHEYLQYQRQLALQRVQEQEREMQMRQEQQKHQYMMSANSGFYMPGVSMHQYQPGYPNQALYSNPQFHPQMMPQATTDGNLPMPGQPQMSQANNPMNVNQISQSMPHMSNNFVMSASGMALGQPTSVPTTMNQPNMRPGMNQQLALQQQVMMQQMQQMRLPNQPGVHQMIPPNVPNGLPGQSMPQNPQTTQQLPKQNVPPNQVQQTNPMMPPMTIGQQPNSANPMFTMQMPNMRMPLMQGNQPNNNQQIPVSYPMNVQNPQSSQQATNIPHMPQMQLPGQPMPMPGQPMMQNQAIPGNQQLHQAPQIPQSQGQQISQPQMTQQTMTMPGHPPQQHNQQMQPNHMANQQGQMAPSQQVPQMMAGAMQQAPQMQGHIPNQGQQVQGQIPQNIQGQGMKLQQNYGNDPPNQQQQIPNQQVHQVQTPVKSENNNNTAELISFD
ncbi:unnamed protein product, partial [Brenthis ino]